MPSDLLTTDEVLDEIVKRPELRKVAAHCVLPALRCGGEWKYRRSDLDAWIDEQQQIREPAALEHRR